MGNISRPKALGIAIADNLIELANLFYNAGRARAFIKIIIERLLERIGEIQPKKADPEYFKARYGKKPKNNRKPKKKERKDE